MKPRKNGSVRDSSFFECAIITDFSATYIDIYSMSNIETEWKFAPIETERDKSRLSLCRVQCYLSSRCLLCSFKTGNWQNMFFKSSSLVEKDQLLRFLILNILKYCMCCKFDWIEDTRGLRLKQKKGSILPNVFWIFRIWTMTRTDSSEKNIKSIVAGGYKWTLYAYIPRKRPFFPYRHKLWLFWFTLFSLFMGKNH